ncbi:hypothetical protein GE107_00125 [Cohnella sp. CFH 77786]|uniref:hypothetical protein n=1 Tax=Cohnella sp. CFH 77786 TaxID=2662265 RepID=UPI001C60FE65|nr:hypothetical protein [Cohnella sp. CFH 77786]MBW5444469.1 hypothetical protein [Cohnella sp. CFH 77786]
MEIKRLAESIAREIVRELIGSGLTATGTAPPEPPKVLYVFADSTAHEAYSDDFITLRNGGIAFDLLFLDGDTSAWLGKHRIESGGPGKVIAVDEFAPAPIEVPLEYDGIVIPEIDLDSMGRASLAIRGTVLSEVIFAALVTGKPVLIGEDASGLKRADRRTLKTLTLPKPYRNLFDYYRHELAMYGARFGPRAQLAEMAVREWGTSAANAEQAAEGAEKPASTLVTAETESELRFEGRLVAAEWVERRLKEKAFTRLTVGHGTILTPLAKDLLREKGITVHVADER